MNVTDMLTTNVEASSASTGSGSSSSSSGAGAVQGQGSQQQPLTMIIPRQTSAPDGQPPGAGAGAITPQTYHSPMQQQPPQQQQQQQQQQQHHLHQQTISPTYAPPFRPQHNQLSQPMDWSPNRRHSIPEGSMIQNAQHSHHSAPISPYPPQSPAHIQPGGPSGYPSHPGGYYAMQPGPYGHPQYQQAPHPQMQYPRPQWQQPMQFQQQQHQHHSYSQIPIQPHGHDQRQHLSNAPPSISPIQTNLNMGSGAGTYPYGSAGVSPQHHRPPLGQPQSPYRMYSDPGSSGGNPVPQVPMSIQMQLQTSEQPGSRSMGGVGPGWPMPLSSAQQQHHQQIQQQRRMSWDVQGHSGSHATNVGQMGGGSTPPVKTRPSPSSEGRAEVANMENEVGPKAATSRTSGAESMVSSAPADGEEVGKEAVKRAGESKASAKARLKGEKTASAGGTPAEPQPQCYCHETKSDLVRPPFTCLKCSKTFHQACILALKSWKYETFLGDDYYHFICRDCNEGKEVIRRVVLTWSDVAHVVLFNLHHNGSESRTAPDGKRVYFARKQIVPFIDANWDKFWLKPRPQNWGASVSNSLSAATAWVISGKDLFPNEASGFWSLINPDAFPCSYEHVKRPRNPAYDILEDGTLVEMGQTAPPPPAPISNGVGTTLTVGGLAGVLKKKRKAEAGGGEESDGDSIESGNSAQKKLKSSSGAKGEAEDSGVIVKKKKIVFPHKPKLAPRIPPPEEGYRMAKSSHGVYDGFWYYEITFNSNEQGHARVGWSQISGDLQGPCGYDQFSYSYRDSPGTLFHNSKAITVNDEFKAGFVQDVDSMIRRLWKENTSYVQFRTNPMKTIPGSEIRFFKNGVELGVGFKDLYAGKYHAAVSSYKGGSVNVNFGPNFAYSPPAGARPYCEVSEVVAWTNYAVYGDGTNTPPPPQLRKMGKNPTRRVVKTGGTSNDNGSSVERVDGRRRVKKRRKKVVNVMVGERAGEGGVLVGDSANAGISNGTGDETSSVASGARRADVEGAGTLDNDEEDESVFDDEDDDDEEEGDAEGDEIDEEDGEGDEMRKTPSDESNVNSDGVDDLVTSPMEDIKDEKGGHISGDATEGHVLDAE
ncbi:transcription factor, contains a PHD finger motif, partial [Blyttiomyces sp. JEL0837]